MYLLLHDNSRGDAGRAKTILEQMMGKFGTSSSFYLPINSRKTPNDPAAADFWFPYSNLEAATSIGASTDLSRAASMVSLASADIGHRRMPSAGLSARFDRSSHE